MSTWTRRRRALAATATGCLVVGMMMVGGGAAMAADGPYNIDGNVPDPGTTELDDPEGNIQELGPENGASTKIGVIHADALPTLGTTNPNAQVDLRRAWLDVEREGTKDWLYFAWERDKNTGSGFIAYEFMKNKAPAACAYETALEADLIANCNPWANRTAGDFMILWDQQGGATALVLRTWSGTAPNLTLGAGVTLNSTVSQAQYSPDGFFGEAAVNLTDTIFGGVTQCLSFANTIPSTVTGNSDTADYKDTILRTTPPITNCASATVTTPKDGAGASIPAGGLSIGTGVVAVKDSAVVSLTGGTATPAGSVAFSLCKVDAPTLCTGTSGTSIGSTNLSTAPGATYPQTVVSPTAYVTSAGRYCWRATFTGDSANGIPGSSDSSATECFTVNPVTPTLATTAGTGGTLGSPVSDSATLTGLATQPADPVINTTGTGGAAAGGTVTFKLYGPNDCTTLAYTSPAVAISATGTASTPAPQFVPTLAGTYHWKAEYSGNLPNNNATSHNSACADTNEDVTLTSVASSLTSSQSWVPNDSVTITVPAGSGLIVGNVDFKLFAGDSCQGDALYTLLDVGVTTADPTADTANTIARPAGTYSWLVNYDSTGNSAQRDIADTCHETSTLTIANGGTISSAP